LIKTKRSAAFWLSVIGAAVIPLIFLLSYLIKPDNGYRYLHDMPWEKHISQAWQVFNSFLLPMFVILICSLVPQIEFKNNAWKQVFASPQSIGNIFFSKYLTILLMILFLFLLFNIFLILAAVIPNMIYPRYTFFNNLIDWMEMVRLNLKTLVSLLAIISIQYWISLRFRNFIVPIGIGLGLLVISLVLLNFHWEDIYKVPFAFPILTVISIGDKQPARHLLENHELNSIGYFAFFTLLAFVDMRFRKERG